MKKSPKAIWAVSSGSYSDYGVICVCPSKAIAEAVAKKINDSGDSYSYETARPEAFPLVSSLDEMFTYSIYCVETDGTGAETRRWTAKARSWDRYTLESAAWNPGGGARSRGVSRRGYDEALKAARDELAKHKAKKAGVAG